MSRPTKLKEDQLQRVTDRLLKRQDLLGSLTDFTLKQIARTEGVSYGIVWRVNAKLHGKRSYKNQDPPKLDTPSLESTNAG